MGAILAAVREATTVALMSAALCVLAWQCEPARAQPLATTLEATLGRGTESSSYGSSIAITADGSIAVVGDRSAPGLISVFARYDARWERLTHVPLTGPWNVTSAIAVDADATRIVVSAYGASRPSGAYVFVRTVDGWTLEAELPLGETSEPGDVAVSAAGDRFLLGAWATGDPELVHVYVRTDSRWSLEATLRSSRDGRLAGFGRTVALNAEGSLALIGANEDGPGRRGAAYLFRRTGSVWSEEARLEGAATALAFGAKVALDSAGSRAFVNDPHQQPEDVARIHVFERVGDVWTETAVFPEGSGGVDASFAVNDVGDRATLAGSYDGLRFVRVFASIGGAWREEVPLAPPPGVVEGASFVDLDDAGTRVLVGVLPRALGMPGHAFVYRLDVAGGSCATSADCVAGTCADGVCCNEPCSDVCEACSTDAGTAVDGRCGPLLADAPTEVCRASAHSCDPAELCVEGTRGCPDNEYAADGTPCEGTDPCIDRRECEGRRCTRFGPLDCDDGIACTADTCDPAIGCMHTRSPECSPDAQRADAASFTPDARVPLDASVEDASTSDAGVTHVSYCGCRAFTTTSPPPVLLASGLVWAFAILRRRQRGA